MTGQRRRPVGEVPLRRNRDFLLYWSGQALSSLGSRATSVAYPLLVLAASGSAIQAGSVGFVQTLPFLLWFLPAGSLVDRVDRKRLMLACELARFAAMVTLVTTLVTDRYSLTVVLIVAFVEGTALVFFELAEAAALPHIVPATQLPTALAQSQARQQAADLAGQPLGGLLFGLSRSVPFVFDAVTYAASFASLTLVRPDFQEARPPSAQPTRHHLTEGVRWLWHQPFLRACALLVAGWNFVLSALVLAVIVRVQDLGGGPTVVGLVLAAFGVGALVGSAVAPSLQRRLAGRTIVIGCCGLVAVAWALLAPAPNPWVLAAVVAAGSTLTPIFTVMLGAYRYAITPDALQGRVFSAFRVVAWGSIPLGSLASGLALEAWGARPTLVALAAVMAAEAVTAALLPGLRRDPLAASDG